MVSFFCCCFECNFYDSRDGFLTISLFTGFTAQVNEKSLSKAVRFIGNSDDHIRMTDKMIRNDRYGFYDRNTLLSFTVI